jgi:hypothetical protein
MQKTIIALGIAALLWGCASQQSSRQQASASGDDAPRCIESKVEQCPCPDGQQGTQTCTAEGKYGICQCPAAQPSTPEGQATEAQDPADAKRLAIEQALELERQITELQTAINAQEKAKREAEEALAEARTEKEKAAAQARWEQANQSLSELREKLKAWSEKPQPKLEIADECLEDPLNC